MNVRDLARFVEDVGARHRRGAVVCGLHTSGHELGGPGESKMLHVIELNAVQYGLKLNRSKREAVMMRPDGAEVRFEECTGLAQSPEVR